MTSAVLTKSDVAVDQRRFDWRKFGDAQISFAEELVDRPGTDRTEEHSLAIDPTTFHLKRTAAYEYGSRSALGD